MPTNQQRREAERRRLRRQAQRRQRRSAQRRRLNLITSIVGAIVVIAIVVVFIVATTNDDKTPTAHKGSPAPTSSASPTASSPDPSSSAPSKSVSSSGSSSGSRSPSESRSTSTSPSPSRSVSPSPSNTATSSAPVGTVGRTVQCTYTSSGVRAARKVTRPPSEAAASGTVEVAITTSQGPMTFTLYRKAAPCAANSFVSLVQQKYYNSTPCHRLVTKTIFVTQCGDPTGTGMGGPGYTFDDELTGKERYTPGILAMANAGVNSNGSQFFIIDKNSPLGPHYTIFGRVTSGFSTAQKVAAAGTADGSTDGPPKLALTIRTATLG